MKKPRRFRTVAVLLGGPSGEREVSLKSGAAVAGALREQGYEVAEVDPADGTLELPAGVEAVFVALHGTFGEDGTVQQLLRERGVPYTGCGPGASRLAFDKILTKQRLVDAGLPTPDYEVLTAGTLHSLPLPVVLKPPRQGSSLGLAVVRAEEEWPTAWEQAARYDREILVEAYVEGAELTVGVVDGEVLPVVEIRAKSGSYDYEAKYTKGKTDYLVPAPLVPAMTARCQALARAVYAAVDARGMARVDFRLADGGDPSILEINTIPGFTETSLLPMAAREAGMNFPELCGRIMETAAL